MLPDWLVAIILGIVEGLTEFIPVSSTGHLILAKSAIEAAGLTKTNWDTFIVLIQLGAILAVVLLYFQRLWRVAIRLPRDPAARNFALSVIVAFLPAALLAVLFLKNIEAALDNPALICVTLIVGGVGLIILDHLRITPRHKDAMRFPLLTSVGIGLFQCLSLIPGVSRSGATITGALLLGTEKRAAAEFSFFLAIPTMLGAFVFDFAKHRKEMDFHNLGTLAIGFVVSFVVGLIVVRGLLDFVSKRGFTIFGVWRIVIGALGLALLHFVR
jgi:undecaprenyl-diphosphatase